MTIKDVARHAGVSFKTVSRVVNNEPTVQDSYREKVRRSIEVLGYQVDVAARNLRAKRSRAIALVYDQPLADIQKGVLAACRARGFGLQIHPFDLANQSISAELIRIAGLSRLAGLVLTPPLSENREVVNELLGADLKVVTIISSERPPDLEHPCVSVDDYSAARDLTEYLIRNGHERIAFIWGDKSHRSSRERFRGYSDALSLAGIRPIKSLVTEGEYTFDSGRRCGAKLLRGEPRPTAIVGSNDEIASGAMAAARMLGLEVPTDVSIVGFEDSVFSRAAWPRITTAKQPTEEIARKAADLLIDDILELEGSPGMASFSTELVIRESTSIRT